MASHDAPAMLGSLKATLGGAMPEGGAHAVPSISATARAHSENAPLGPLDLDDTLGAPQAAPLSGTMSSAGTAAGRTTVLPRRNKAGETAPVATGQLSRFERVRLLGEGAMGQVELARDNDIRRTVAVKRIAGHAAKNVPVEYIYIVAKGLARDRAKRFQSVDELEQEINKARDGFGPVKCHLTLGKRVAYGMAHFIDRHFILYSVLFFGTAAAIVFGTVFAL